MSVVPRRYARFVLERPWNLTWLTVVNALAILVGIDFYLGSLPAVFTFLWPFYLDSPVALFLMTGSLLTLWPNAGRSLEAAPRSRPQAYLNTLAVAWLVKYGLWTVVALNLRPSLYYPEAWSYFGILLTHALFLPEADIVGQFGRTTKGALATALLLLLVNDAIDYGLGYHPPLRYDVGLVLPSVSVVLSVVAVATAWVLLPRLSDSSNGRPVEE